MTPLFSALPFEAHSLIVSVLHFVAAVLVTIHTLLRKRDVPAAIGWIGMAWLAPFVGAFLYVCFGVNRVKRRARRLRRRRRASDDARTDDTESVDPFELMKIAVGRIARQDLSSGDFVSILENGDEAYPEMLAAIDAAKLSVSLGTYIFRGDALGQKFVDALAGAHGRGVDVRVLIDGVGGNFVLSPAYHALRKAAVPAARFLHSFLPWQMPYLDLRLHKKCLIIDGAFAFVGGLNIGSENILAEHPSWPVRDHHFRVEGPVVRQLADQFEEDWSFTTKQPARATVEPPPAPGPCSPARAIVTGPDQDEERLTLVLLSAIHLARTSIRILTPYFLPDEQLVTALQLAAMRGVEIDIVLPEVSDNRLIAWAVPAHVRPLLTSGCRIWWNPPPFEHSKLTTVDDEWSLIGSGNWDMRSLRLNFEMCVEVYDRRFASALGERIDARRVRRLTLHEIDHRPLPLKLRDSAARLAMPYI